MKRILAGWLILVAAAWLGAEKITTLPDLHKPQRLVVEKRRVYLGEFPHVYVYSRADWRLLRKFGRQGEGPHEFAGFVSLFLQENKLLVNSLGKVSRFTLAGDYIAEKRVNARSSSGLVPVGPDRYVARGMTAHEGQRYFVINLLDGGMNKLKELGRLPIEAQKGRIRILAEQMEYRTDGSRIFVLTGDEFVIRVFDSDGNLQNTLSPQYERMKFTAAHKHMVLEEMRNNPRVKPHFERLKALTVFPDYWPAVFTFFPRGDRLRVLTFRRGDKGTEIVTLDMEGRIKSRRMLPLKYPTAMEPYPVDVSEGRLYQVMENDDGEWELHAWPL